MFTRGFRITVLVLALATVALAGHRLVILHDARAAAASAAATLDHDAARVLAGMQDLRAAQQAYVAAGQNEQVWTGKVSTLLPQIADGLTRLQRAARVSGDSATAASKALAALGKADIRAREYLSEGQALMASDVIFSEARDALATTAAATDELRQREATARAADVAALERQQLYTAAGAAGGLLLFVLLLLPVPRPVVASPAAVAPAPATTPLTAEERSILNQPLRLDEPLLARPAEVPSGGAASVAPAGPVEAPDEALDEIATLCTDFGRLTDSAQIGDLLARAAPLARATGLILWVADRSGEVLHAVAAHGYDARVLARLGPIPRTAENATAAAYRAAHVHTVPGDATRNGAIVVPLLGPDGCVGVLTAEVAAGDERRASARALATIVAAQLATLVAALPSSEGAARG